MTRSPGRRTGVLRTAWTRDHEQLHRDAEDAALDAERGLKSVGRQSDADALREAMTLARTRDLFVRLQWAGDGDLDLSVEEPLGTTCSVIDPQSQGGGVHMHDGYGPKPEDCYEEYICRASERPAFTSSACVGSTATSSASGRSFTVVLNQGGPNETSQSFVLKLDKDAAAIRIPVPNGRRRQLAPERRVMEGHSAVLNRIIEFVAHSPSPRSIRWSSLPTSFAPGVALPRKGRTRQVGGGGVVNAGGQVSGQGVNGSPVIGQVGVGGGGIGNVGGAERAGRRIGRRLRAANRGNSRGFDDDGSRRDLGRFALRAAGGRPEFLDNQRSLHVHLRR